MNLKDKYKNLLTFFDPKKYDHDEMADAMEKIIHIVKQRGGDHQLGCAWVVTLLYKNSKITFLQIEDTIEEFYQYCGGYDEYINSIVIGDKFDNDLTYYNYFLRKKMKGE